MECLYQKKIELKYGNCTLYLHRKLKKQLINKKRFYNTKLGL